MRAREVLFTGKTGEEMAKVRMGLFPGEVPVNDLNSMGMMVPWLMRVGGNSL